MYRTAILLMRHCRTKTSTLQVNYGSEASRERRRAPRVVREPMKPVKNHDEGAEDRCQLQEQLRGLLMLSTSPADCSQSGIDPALYLDIDRRAVGGAAPQCGANARTQALLDTPAGQQSTVDSALAAERALAAHILAAPGAAARIRNQSRLYRNPRAYRPVRQLECTHARHHECGLPVCTQSGETAARQMETYDLIVIGTGDRGTGCGGAGTQGRTLGRGYRSSPVRWHLPVARLRS